MPSISNKPDKELVAILCKILKNGCMIGTTKPYETPTYTTIDMLNLLISLTNSFEKCPIENLVLNELKNKIEKGSFQNKTRILNSLEEIESINKILSLKKELIDKSSTNVTPKLSCECLIERKNKVLKELKELISKD